MNREEVMIDPSSYNLITGDEFFFRSWIEDLLNTGGLTQCLFDKFVDFSDRL